MVGTLLRSAAIPAQLTRFALAGGTANLVYAALFLLLADAGTQPANFAASLASAAVANELHRRLTFRAGARVGWRAAQLQGGGTALAGLAASGAALALAAPVGSAGGVPALLLAASVHGAVGLARFALLRWLFTRTPAAPVVPLRRPGAPAPSAVAAPLRAVA